jgi:hypothetical protein
MVSPIKAAGALIGFAAGFAATYRSGGAISDSIYHGIFGALLVMPLAWFLALFLVREGIKANVAEQQRAYQSKLLRAQRQVAEQMQAGGMVLPPAMQELLRSTPPQLGPGSG